MAETISIEVVGLKDSTCSPFPCDMTRSCGLYDCHPTGKLVPAFEALKKELREQFGSGIEMRLVLIDEDMPEHIREIIATHYPPPPICDHEWKTDPDGPDIAADDAKRD